MDIKANIGPKLTLTITEKERSTAKQIKEDFKKIVKLLDKSVKVIVDLKTAVLEQHPSKEDLKNKYRSKLLRYRRKIQDSTNELLINIKSSLEMIGTIADPEMIRLREIIIAEVSELSDIVKSALDLLKESNKEGFTQTLEKICGQLEKRQNSILDVIDNQLFRHIDRDILGRMKISTINFNIKKRMRIMKQLGRNK